jgi:hypothetical protein
MKPRQILKYKYLSSQVQPINEQTDHWQCTYANQFVFFKYNSSFVKPNETFKKMKRWLSTAQFELFISIEWNAKVGFREK